MSSGSGGPLPLSFTIEVNLGNNNRGVSLFKAFIKTISDTQQLGDEL